MLPEGRTEKCDTPGSVIAQVPWLWEQFTGDVYMSSDSGSEFSFLELHECHPCFLCACWERRCKSTAKRVQEGQWDRFEVECDCDKLGLREHNIAKESEGEKKNSSAGCHSSAQPFLTGKKKTENSENGIQRCSTHLRKHLYSSSSSFQGFAALTRFKLTSQGHTTYP